jgi:signal transduction histidine kinase
MGEHPREIDAPMVILRRGIDRMDALIRDLLTLSRIDAELAGAVAQTANVALNLQEQLSPKLKSVDGVLRLELEPAVVRCSEALLGQLLWNLGENSVKYRRTDVRLQLDIQGRRFGESYELRIADNGTGMSPEVVRQAFDPFFRAQGVRSLPGTGLGLSIVKRVIDVSGGKVSVDSELNKGTTFVIELLLGTSVNSAGDSG